MKKKFFKHIAICIVTVLLLNVLFVSVVAKGKYEIDFKPDNNEHFNETITMPVNTVPVPTKQKPSTTLQTQTTTQKKHNETTEKVVNNMWLNLTIKTQLPTEFPMDSVITFTLYHLSDKADFKVTLNKNNGYFDMLLLPAGEYVIKDCSFSKNPENRYKLTNEGEHFTLSGALNADYNITVLDTAVKSTNIVDNNNTIASTTVPVSTTEEAPITITEVKPQNKIGPTVACVLFLCALFSVLIYKKYYLKQSDAEDTSTTKSPPSNRF